jgi:hypothetical protein
MISLALTGIACATAYQPMARGGGYTETRVGDTKYSVEFRGNRSTSHEEVEKFLLYRCAELTVASGYDYFVIEEAADRSEVESHLSEGGNMRATGTSTVRRNKCAGNEMGTGEVYVPPVEETSTRPHLSATITMARGTRPADNPSAFDARDLLSRLSVE